MGIFHMVNMEKSPNGWNLLFYSFRYHQSERIPKWGHFQRSMWKNPQMGGIYVTFLQVSSAWKNTRTGSFPMVNVEKSPNGWHLLCRFYRCHQSEKKKQIGLFCIVDVETYPNGWHVLCVLQGCRQSEKIPESAYFQTRNVCPNGQPQKTPNALQVGKKHQIVHPNSTSKFPKLIQPRWDDHMEIIIPI